MESWSAPALRARPARPESLSISVRSPLRRSVTRGEQHGVVSDEQFTFGNEPGLLPRMSCAVHRAPAAGRSDGRPDPLPSRVGASLPGLAPPGGHRHRRDRRRRAAALSPSRLPVPGNGTRAPQDARRSVPAVRLRSAQARSVLRAERTSPASGRARRRLAPARGIRGRVRRARICARFAHGLSKRLPARPGVASPVAHPDEADGCRRAGALRRPRLCLSGTVREPAQAPWRWAIRLSRRALLKLSCRPGSAAGCCIDDQERGRRCGSGSIR